MTVSRTNTHTWIKEVCRFLSVNLTAHFSDLPLRAGQNPDRAHPNHRLGELIGPQPPVLGVVHHHPRSGGAGVERLVGGEEPSVPCQFLVVLVVQPGRGHRLQWNCRVGSSGRVAWHGALGPQEIRVASVECWVPGIEPGREGGAVGDADGVGAGEGHHLVSREPFPCEVVDELLGVEARRWQVLGDFRQEGDTAIPATGRDVVVYPSGLEGAVPSGKSDDISTGDRSRAHGLELGLCLVNHLEPTEARVVGRMVPFGQVSWFRLEKHGSITTLKTMAKLSNSKTHILLDLIRPIWSNESNSRDRVSIVSNQFVRQSDLLKFG